MTKSTAELDKIGKSALKTFGSLSLLVYATALGYCYFTANYFAFGLMGSAMVAIAVLLVVTYKSM